MKITIPFIIKSSKKIIWHVKITEYSTVQYFPILSEIHRNIFSLNHSISELPISNRTSRPYQCIQAIYMYLFSHKQLGSGQPYLAWCLIENWFSCFPSFFLSFVCNIYCTTYILSLFSPTLSTKQKRIWEFKLEFTKGHLLSLRDIKIFCLSSKSNQEFVTVMSIMWKISLW